MAQLAEHGTQHMKHRKVSSGPWALLPVFPAVYQQGEGQEGQWDEADGTAEVFSGGGTIVACLPDVGLWRCEWTVSATRTVQCSNLVCSKCTHSARTVIENLVPAC
jgi:hypothetical protein